MLKLNTYSKDRARVEIIDNMGGGKFKEFIDKIKTLPSAKFIANSKTNKKFWTIEYSDCVQFTQLFFKEGVDYTNGVLNKML